MVIAIEPNAIFFYELEYYSWHNRMTNLFDKFTRKLTIIVIPELLTNKLNIYNDERVSFAKG